MSRHNNGTVVDATVPKAKRHSLDERRPRALHHVVVTCRRQSSPADVSRRRTSHVTTGATVLSGQNYLGQRNVVQQGQFQGQSSRLPVDSSSSRSSMRPRASVAALHLKQLPEANGRSRDVGKPRRRYSAVDVGPNERGWMVDEMMTSSSSSRRRIASFNLRHTHASSSSVLPLAEHRRGSTGNSSHHRSTDQDPIGVAQYNDGIGKQRRGSVNRLHAEMSPERRPTYLGSGIHHAIVPRGRAARNANINEAGDLDRVSSFKRKMSLGADSTATTVTAGFNEIEKTHALDVVFEAKVSAGHTQHHCHQQQQQQSRRQKLAHCLTTSDISDDQLEVAYNNDDEDDVIVADVHPTESISFSSDSSERPASSRRKMTLSLLRQDSAYRSQETQLSSIGSRLQCYERSTLRLADCDQDGRDHEAGNGSRYDVHHCRPFVGAHRKFSIDSRSRNVLERVVDGEAAKWRSDDIGEDCRDGAVRYGVDTRSPNVWNCDRRQSSPLQRF